MSMILEVRESQHVLSGFVTKVKEHHSNNDAI